MLMSKVVILVTNNGTKLIGTTQCSNGSWWDAEGCYKYCNSEGDEYWNQHQANKLLAIATDLGRDSVKDDKWYKNRNNFIDIEIPYNTEQRYRL